MTSKPLGTFPLLLISSLLLILFYLAWLKHLQPSIDYYSQNNLQISAPQPTPAQKLNSPSARKAFERLDISIDHDLFETQYTLNGLAGSSKRLLPMMSVFIRSSDTSSNSRVLQIIDLSQIIDSELDLTELLKFDGADAPSTLRSIMMNNQKYAFSAYVFMEGYQQNNCNYGGGDITNSLVNSDLALGIVVKQSMSISGCDGEVIKTYFPNEDVLEEVLKLVESIQEK